MSRIKNSKKLILALLGVALIMSCSEDLKPIDRLTAEDLAMLSSSSSEEPLSSSSVEIDSSSSSVETDNYQSSSSGIEEPSSSGGLCAGFDPEAQVEHFGNQKKQFCDERDGKKYVYVLIGEQTWMAENLNYDPGKEGNSTCYTDGENCNIYGRFYDWKTAMVLEAKCNNDKCKNEIQSPHKGICPDGWYIPSFEDWCKLLMYVNGFSLEGISYCSGLDFESYKLKTAFFHGYDDYGFSALLGGYGHSPDNLHFDDNGYWWSASAYEYDHSIADYLYIHDNKAYINYLSHQNELQKIHLLSVRCLKD